MASRRLLSSLLRSSSRRSVSKSLLFNRTCRLSSPSPSSTHSASPYGYLLIHASEYATSATTAAPPSPSLVSDGTEGLVRGRHVLNTGSSITGSGRKGVQGGSRSQ